MRFWDEVQDDFEEVTPVSLIGTFYDHFKQNADEYNYRIWFRGLSNTTLKEFKTIAFSPIAGYPVTWSASFDQVLMLRGGPLYKDWSADIRITVSQ